MCHVTQHDFRSRIELLQDAEFTVASTRVRFTRDGLSMVAIGTYKLRDLSLSLSLSLSLTLSWHRPCIRYWDVNELTLKTERHISCEAVDFCLVGDDWSKLVLVRSDRFLEFHDRVGVHYMTRVPRHVRAIAFDHDSCDLFAVGSSSQAFRLNLEQGRFLAPFETAMPGINTVAVNPVHSLTALGGEGGVVEAWDGRDRRKCGAVQVALPSVHGSPTVTAFAYADDGMTMAVGTEGGSVLLYDLRSATPLLVKEQGNGERIQSLVFHGVSSTDNEHASTRAALSAFAGSGPCVISCDRRLMKVWDQRTAETRVNVEVSARINQATTYSADSGLIVMASEQPKLQIFYVPFLGPAPRWAAFIDNMTEELEEGRNQQTFDNFKFVTRDDLAKVGLEHLVGTAYLRPYMHGFFVDVRLYTKMLSTVNPFAFEEYRKQRIKDRVEEKRATRITQRKRAPPPVNAKLAESLQARALERRSDGDGDAAPAPDEAPDAASLIDARFRDLFTNPDFELGDDARLRRATGAYDSDSEDNITTAADVEADRQSLFEVRGEQSLKAVAAATAAALRGGSLTEQLRDVVQARSVPLSVRAADEPTDAIQFERTVREMTYVPHEAPKAKRTKKQMKR